MNNPTYGTNISIEVVSGGFILTIPLETGEYSREVFTSARKMNQKLKEVIESLSLVPVNGD